MSKKKTNTTNTVTYGQITPNDTADITNYRNLVNQGADFTSPVVSQYGQAANDINNQTFENNLPSNIQNRIRQGELFNNDMNKGAALSQAKMQEYAYKTGNAASLAGLTAPRIVSTGGTQNTVQQGGMLESILGPAIGGAASVAA